MRRLSTPIRNLAIASLILAMVTAWLAACRTHWETTIDALLVEISSASLSFAAASIIVGYLIARDRRSRWRGLQRVAIASLWRRLAHVVWEFHFRLVTAEWPPYAERVESCDADPSPKGLADLKQKLADILGSLATLKGDYHAVLQLPDGQPYTGLSFADSLKALTRARFPAEIRLLATPLQFNPEENLALLRALEDWLAVLWRADQFGDAARMGELGEASFMDLFSQTVQKFDNLLSVILQEWTQKP